MADVLSPFVYWGQNKDTVRLLVDLKEVCDPKVDLQEDALVFSASGMGLTGHNNYALDIQFYLPVDPEKSKYKVMERGIEFQIQKVGLGEVWPRLMVGKQKPPWLKIDFDHLAYDGETDDEAAEKDEAVIEQEERLEKLARELRRDPDLELPSRLTVYMFLYNMFQFVGYTFVFATICYRYCKYGDASKPGTFDAVKPQLMMCQIIAVLEIIHPMLGWVRSSSFTAFMQVFGRNMILFGLIAQEPKLQEHAAIFWLFSVWTFVEVIRFPYYILKTLNIEWGLVTWLRYTLWIPLYPMGFILEGVCMLLSMPHFEESERWCVFLPNTWNISFHFPTFLKIYMLIFLPSTYILMKHMYQLRKKKIRPSKRPMKKQKSQ